MHFAKKIKESLFESLILWFLAEMILIGVFEWWSFSIMLHLLIASIIFTVAAVKKMPFLMLAFLIIEAISFSIGLSTKTALIIIYLIIPFLCVILILKLHAHKEKIF